jgi:hypothetical protein
VKLQLRGRSVGTGKTCDPALAGEGDGFTLTVRCSAANGRGDASADWIGTASLMRKRPINCRRCDDVSEVVVHDDRSARDHSIGSKSGNHNRGGGCDRMIVKSRTVFCSRNLHPL